MQIIKFISLILALYFTFSVVVRAYIITLSVKYNRTNLQGGQVTVLRLLLWALSVGTFIYLQWLK
jgi:hypothetical protein